MKTAEQARKEASQRHQVEINRANRDAIRKIESSIERAVENGAMCCEVSFPYDHKFNHSTINTHFENLGYKISSNCRGSTMYEESDSGILVKVSW